MYQAYIHKNKSGFSVIEVLVVMGLFALIAGVIGSSVLYFYRTNSYAVEQIYAVESARRGVDLMVRDMREAAYSDHGAYPLISMSDTELLFYSDIDKDESVERIRYRLNNSILEKGVVNASGSPLVYDDEDESFSFVSTDVLNEQESESVFTYFDESGAEVADLSDVTAVVFIQVNLIVNSDPSRAPQNFTLRSSATLRNIKTNL